MTRLTNPAEWLAKVASGEITLTSKLKKEMLFARPPEGTPWPTPVMHLSFESCWLMQFDTLLGKSVYESMDLSETDKNTLVLRQMAAVQQWFNTNGATVFVRDDVLAASRDIESLRDIKGSDVRPVHSSFMIALPTHLQLKSPVGDDVITHVVVSFFEGPTIVNFAGVGTFDLGLRGDANNAKLRASMIVCGMWLSGAVTSIAIPMDCDESLVDTVRSASLRLFEDEDRVASINIVDKLRERSETLHMREVMVSLAINTNLFMQSYPKYVTRLSANTDRQMRVGRRGDNVPPTYLLTTTHGRTTEPPALDETPQARGEAESTGPSRRTHWRCAHWRRQRHTAAWEAENPDIKVVEYGEGVRAHLVHIPRVFVNTKKKL